MSRNPRTEEVVVMKITYEILAALRDAVERAGGAGELARRCGVNPANLSRYLNGKVRTTIMIDKDESKESAITKGKEAIADKLTGNIIKEIYVPGKIVNIVMK